MELSQGTPSSSQPQTQPDPAAQAAAAAHYFASRAAAAAAAGLLRTDREHLCDLEHKLLQARQRVRSRLYHTHLSFEFPWCWQVSSELAKLGSIVLKFRVVIVVKRKKEKPLVMLVSFEYRNFTSL